MWAGNTGTPPGAGSGTCGSGPSNSLAGAGYSNAYVYTHLGQLWQGPYNGTGSYQYLYCNSSQPHELTGLYPTGTTCATTGGKTQTYGAQYDSWGNLTTRTATGSGSTTATLAYDGLDHLVRWNDSVTSTNEEWYLYDGAGQRVVRRSQTGTGTSNTKYTVYAFGVQDDVYDGSGASNNNKYYYSLAGRLIGELNGGSTKYLLTDALGSVVASISNTVGSAAVLGNQVYGPYGNTPYSKGTITTPKGYTGQYTDGLTQLDYYNARYYDPFVGVFLSADTASGNMAGMNPYAYVGGNPETHSDPTGRYLVGPNGETYYPGSSYYTYNGVKYPLNQAPPKPSPTTTSCGAGTHQVGNQCVANILNCGAGTVQQGNTCVSDANSKAGQVRDNRLAGQLHLSLGKQIAGYALFILGDVLNFWKGSGAGKVAVIIDVIATFVTNIMPLIGAWFNGSAPPLFYKIESGLMWLMTGAESLYTIYTRGNWWQKAGADLVADVLATAAGGPISIAVKVVLTLVTPIVGNLLDIGGHALLASGLSDFEDYDRQMQMPIKNWCAQYGGCPAVL